MQKDAAADAYLIDNCGDIDSSWLTAVMHTAGYADAKVESFVATPIGAGNVSDTLRVALAYAGPTEAPASVVCKFRCREVTAHAHGVASGSYFRELQSYRTLMAASNTCRTPKAFWVEGNPENINLVMEDLSGTARAGDQIVGCGVVDARSVVAELARLHRTFYPMSRAAAPAWGMSMADTADYWGAAIDRALPIIREHVAPRLSATEIAIVEQAHVRARAWYRLPMPRGTLTHGDPRVDNILFIDGEADVQAVLIDWQITGWRNPMHDVGYFLSGSVSIEDRRANEHSLLDTYAKVFGADRGYDRATIEADYRLQLPSGLMTTIASYGLIPLTPAVDKLLLTLLQRNAAAVADWHSLDALDDTVSA